MNRRERAIRKLLEERRRTPKPWVGLVGDGSGAVQVPGHPQMWYVRPKGGGLPLVVRGGSAPFIEGTEVLVGPDPYRRGLVRVLGTYFIDGSSGSGETQNIGPHAASHYEDGSDPVAITTRQVTNGLVYAHTGLILGVYAGWVVIDNQAVKYAATAIDMTSHVPGSGARYCLIRVNAAGVVSVQDGTPVASVLDLTQADVPLLAAGYSLLAIVRMYYGQTAISRLVSAPDVFDLRFSPRARTIGVATAAANTVYAGPTSGAADEPTFRALVAADVGSGTPNGTRFLRDDMTWSAAAGGGTSTDIFAGITIADTTVGAGGVENVTFSSIGTYDRLEISGFVRSNKADTTDLWYIFLNADETQSNYFERIAFNVTGHGNADSSFLGTISAANSPAGAFAHVLIQIDLPSDTTCHKQIVFSVAERRQDGEGYTWWGHINWENTAAVTSIKLDVDSTNKFAEGSRLILRGYKTITVVT